ncbi:MAG: aminotransferase class III-fold pyridoxal phosphate-dependent enzyme [Armatimonadetes bacterium]|nr:aminotransferase class III-fold pyridoxal phosphate-dependent enzyme [Armatimonadota bacterium]
MSVGSPSVARSLQLYRRALELIPGGTQLISRRPSRYAYGACPIYAESAAGARIRDVDGNSWLDWVSAVGPAILGYGNRAVDEAVQQQIGKGAVFTINHPAEVELAEQLVATIPCAEQVRYCKGGGEACAIAVRIARGATGRDRVLFCGYHGWHDWYLAANLEDDTRLDTHLFSGIEPIGVPRALAGTAIPFPYADLPALEALLARHEGEVAAVIMEPMRSEFPPAGYLEGVQAATRRAGAVLIFDEVSTGYRPALGGAQELLGVTPDLAVFAKSMSNGYAMGAVVGRRSVMESAGPMFVSSTYWSDAIGLVASLATLAELRSTEGVARLQATGRLLQQQLNAALNEVGLPGQCTGPCWHPTLQFTALSDQDRRLAATLFIQEMARAGILTLTGFYMNCAHSAEDVGQTASAARGAFEKIRAGLEGGSLQAFLQVEVVEEPFRRMVR